MSINSELKTQIPKPATFPSSRLSIFLLTFFLFLALVVTFGTKPLLALYHQQQAGRALVQVLPVGENEYGGFACLRPFVEDLEQRETLKVALNHLRKAESYAPQLSHTYYLLGRTLCLLGDYENAVLAFLRFSELRPKNPLGYLEMGFVLLQSCPPNGKCPDGLNTYDAWRKAGVRAEDFLVLAEKARQKEDYETALLWYQNAQRMGMELRSTIFYMRYLLLRTKDKDSSKELLEWAINYNRGWVDASIRFAAWHWYARQLYEQKKITKAEATFNRAISYYTGNRSDDWALSECYRFLGLISFYHLRQYFAAEKYFRLALDAYPKNSWAYVGLGISIYNNDKNNITISKQYFQEAINLDKKNPILWKTLVNFWVSVNRADIARDYCEKAVENGMANWGIEFCRNIYP